ncbi:AAA family ATPase [Psychromonas ossibalaenae]|uniref:AAA family ATPase n=1 Tax=Psychromonas ossibalaenae TaxID=444922 RepID=UPI0003697DA1|nr:AAA family ATPase [Psychromonas ossibalaenae]
MYQEFFSLQTPPFLLSPDPFFLFLSERHKEALAHLRHGLEGRGGLVLLTGEVGTGKTTVCRSLLQDHAENIDIAFILNPALTEVELIESVCDQFKIAYDSNNICLKTLLELLTAWLLENHQQGHRAIILIDEAQHLSFLDLQLLSVLANIEADNKKVLQVILIGQTELQQLLKRSEFSQLAQQITARYHLLALTRQESEDYIRHRLNVAGVYGPVFDKQALSLVFEVSGGIPRIINLLCDRSLLCAYVQNCSAVTAALVKKAGFETELLIKQPFLLPSLKYVPTVIILGCICLLTVMLAPKVFARFEAAAVKTESSPVPAPEHIENFEKSTSSEILSLRRLNAAQLVYIMNYFSVETAATADKAEFYTLQPEIEINKTELLSVPPLVEGNTAEPFSAKSTAVINNSEPADIPPPVINKTKAPPVSKQVNAVEAIKTVDSEIKLRPEPSLEQKTQDIVQLQKPAENQSVEQMFTPSEQLLAVSPAAYTVQLSGFASPVVLRRFFVQHNLPRQDIYIYQTLRNNKPWYVVISGQYHGFKVAKEAAEHLPGSLFGMPFWIKTYRDVHKQVHLNEQ